MVDNVVDLPAGKRKFRQFPKGEVTQETLMKLMSNHGVGISASHFAMID